MQTQTLNIALPKDLVKKVDARAEKEYRNRSELIREALRIYLTDIQEWEGIFEYGEKQAKKIGVKNDEDVNKLISQYRKTK